MADLIIFSKFWNFFYDIYTSEVKIDTPFILHFQNRGPELAITAYQNDVRVGPIKIPTYPDLVERFVEKFDHMLLTADDPATEWRVTSGMGGFFLSHKIGNFFFFYTLISTKQWA